MICKRGHGKWFQTKRVGRKTKFCDYIMGYKMKGDQGTRVIYCGDLRKGSKIPDGWIKFGGETLI